MKLLFVLPAIGKKKGGKYIGTWKMEPLTIAMLKALTPPHIETIFFDDRIETIDYDCKPDVVAITTETYTAKRAYNIAQKFRNQGATIIMGGYHATLQTDEVLEYADCVVKGNAENVWAQLIKDIENNSLKNIYQGEVVYTDILPDRSIFKNKKYLPLNLVETGRGCNFKCNFCAISSYYSATYYPRRIDQIIASIKHSEHNFFFFVDDNIVADPAFALQLFKALVPLKIKWSGQATLTFAKNKELLYWMKKSGCEVILIGFESLDSKSLEQMSKEWNAQIGNQDELIKNIHRTGINIYATFVFGFDNDTEKSVDDALRFAKKHKFYIAAFNHLLPFPGTDLYRTLLKNNRLTTKKWWLDSDYSYGEICFEPEKVTAKNLSLACLQARQEFFSFGSIFKRGLSLFGRKTSLMIFGNFWLQNFALKREVNEKFGIPIGSGLEEDNR